MSIDVSNTLNKKNALPYLAPIVLSQIPLLALRWNRFLPPSTGWFFVWSEALGSRRPYDKFEIRLPPLSLILEGWLPRYLSKITTLDIYLVERLWHCLFWLVFSVAIATLINAIRGVLTSTIPIIIALTLYQCQPYKMISGYLELAIIFWAFATAMLFNEVINHANRLRTGRALVITGLFVASLLTKQSFIIPAALSCIGALIGCNGRRLKIVLVLASSFAVWSTFVASLAIFWLGVGGFFGGIANGETKGVGLLSVPQRLLDWGLYSPVRFGSLAAAAGIFAALLHLKNGRSSPTSDGVPGALQSTLFMSCLLILTWGTDSLSDVGLLSFVLAICCSMSLAHSEDIEANRVLDLSARSDLRFGRALVLYICVVSMCAYLRTGSLIRDLGSRQRVVETSSEIGLFLFLGLASLQISSARGARNNNRSPTQLLSVVNDSPTLLRLSAATPILFALPIVNGLSGQTTFESWFLVFAFGAGEIVKLARLRGLSLSLLPLVPLLVSTPIALAFSSPYEWWGIKSGAISIGSHVSVAGLEGFALPDNESGTYNQLVDEVKKIRMISTSFDEDPTSFMGPQIAGLHYLLGMRIFETRCLVIWFDVCSNSGIQRSLVQLKTDTPAVLIWQTLPESVIKGHELGLGNGKRSALRDMQDWILSSDSGLHEVSVVTTPLFSEDQVMHIYVNEKIWKEYKRSGV